jgi:hypothetical protein
LAFEAVIETVKSDGENIQVNLNDDKSKKYRLVFNDDLEKSTFEVVEDESANVQPLSDSEKLSQPQDLPAKSSRKILKPEGQNTITITTSSTTTSALVEIV